MGKHIESKFKIAGIEVGNYGHNQLLLLLPEGSDCLLDYEDKYINDLWDELYTTEEVQKMVDFEKLADYVMEVKYWEAMPDIIKDVNE